MGIPSHMALIISKLFFGNQDDIHLPFFFLSHSYYISFVATSSNTDNDFLVDILDEEVYIEQPSSFFIHKDGKICISIKSMCILIQSPIAYFRWFIKVMKEFSLQRCHNDYFVFYRCYEGINFLLLVYVDDIVIIGGDAEGTKKTLRRLFSWSFKSKSLNWDGTSK